MQASYHSPLEGESQKPSRRGGFVRFCTPAPSPLPLFPILCSGRRLLRALPGLVGNPSLEGKREGVVALLLLEMDQLHPLEFAGALQAGDEVRDPAGLPPDQAPDREDPALLGQLLQPHSRNGLDAVAQQVQHPDRTRLESPEPLDGPDAALHRPAPLLQLLDLPGQVLLVLPLPARPLDSSLQPVATGRLLRPPGQDTPIAPRVTPRTSSL